MLADFKKSLRLKHYFPRTERCYLDWNRRYLAYAGSMDEGAPARSIPSTETVRDFLTYLAVSRRVSASTQNQGFNSLLIFFRLVLNRELGDLKSAVCANTPRRLPVVLSQQEIKLILQQLEGVPGLMLKLIYGGGLRNIECCRMRIKDIDFSQGLVHVRDGKGGKDRTTMLP
ncbi:MAG: phage integrase N-terminal SAM-like domain-containing protein [Desulfofustis sp.]|nr:phage integrase N-terminal SAM-like domain-containing protein [Desulfofustis sp.]